MIGRVVVLVEDQDAALAFYREILGFEVLYDRTTDGYRYLHLGPSGGTTGLWLMPASGPRERELIGGQTGDQPMLVLYTDDLAQVSRHLAEHGVRVWAEREGSLHLADLYGNVIVVAEAP